ncbi:MAG: hypothetical protein KME26_17120 [Oscillatoria princeps RMCB-10]|nr:hypothetical protein [Oscillatoria princeps RMCB-10]
MSGKDIGLTGLSVGVKAILGHFTECRWTSAAAATCAEAAGLVGSILTGGS